MVDEEAFGKTTNSYIGNPVSHVLYCRQLHINCVSLCRCVLLLFNFRAAIYANRLYLSLIHQHQPGLLATNGGESESPHIIGHVRIHPTANIDPTCTVSI